MGNAAVMHFKGYFGKIQLVIKEQFLDPFDLMLYQEFFNGMALGFGKDIGQIGIIVVQLLT